jgi:hypothetical protein
MEPIKPNKMYRYVLHVLIGQIHRVDMVEGCYHRVHDGCYEFFVTKNGREEMIASYPIARTIIFRREGV